MMRMGGEKIRIRLCAIQPDGKLLFAYTDFAPYDKTIENYEEYDSSYSSKITRIWSFSGWSETVRQDSSVCIDKKCGFKTKQALF